jgi:hypothetical protein
VQVLGGQALGVSGHFIAQRVWALPNVLIGSDIFYVFCFPENHGRKPKKMEGIIP